MVLNAYYSYNRFHRSREIKQEFGFVNPEDMAGRACEDRYTNADLVCALCDNGGEIVRCMCTFPSFLFCCPLCVSCHLPGYVKYSECSMTDQCNLSVDIMPFQVEIYIVTLVSIMGMVKEG